MPELPEVEVVRKELNSHIINQKIQEITTYWHKTFVNDCTVSPVNNKIIQTDRIGKYIILVLDKNYIVIHLRMTGQLIYTTDNDFSLNHLRTSIKLHSGSYLNFYDSRKFGRIYHVSNLDLFFEQIGIDALSTEFTLDYFKSILSRKKRGIKSFLLDQKNIAGLGNIYIDESLFLTGIHPVKQTNQINSQKAKELYKNIKTVLINAIKNMGTTISDYRTTGGGFGTNQKFLKVYDRENEPCFNCNTKIKKIRINNRGTHFCPVCQSENGVHQ